jgi:hypothetical protein
VILCGLLDALHDPALAVAGLQEDEERPADQVGRLGGVRVPQHQRRILAGLLVVLQGQRGLRLRQQLARIHPIAACATATLNVARITGACTGKGA